MRIVETPLKTRQVALQAEVRLDIAEVVVAVETIAEQEYSRMPTELIQRLVNAAALISESKQWPEREQTWATK